MEPNSNPNPPHNAMVAGSRKSLEKSRPELVRLEVMKFYLSCRKPMPEPEIMDAEVGVALEDWEGIPTHELPGVCADARRRANGFPPANSLVVEAWQEERERRRRTERDKALYDRARELPPPPKTPEEIEEINRFFTGIRASMGLG